MLWRFTLLLRMCLKNSDSNQVVVINAVGDATFRDLTTRTIVSSDIVKSNRSGTSTCFVAQSSSVDKAIIKADGSATFAGVISADAGIDFSGISSTAASGSVDNNLLDDYEEGTWTPVLTRTGTWTIGAYATGGQEGRYTKVGNKVTAWCQVQNQNISGTPSTKWTLTGFPFTNGRAYNTAGTMGRNYMSGDTNDRDARIKISAAYADLYTTSTDTLYAGNATYAIWECVWTYEAA